MGLEIWFYLGYDLVGIGDLVGFKILFYCRFVWVGLDIWLGRRFLVLHLVRLESWLGWRFGWAALG